MKNIFFILVLLSIIACTEGNVDPNMPKDNDIKLDTIWTEEINTDLSYGIPRDIIITKYGILVNHLLNINSKLILYSFDGNKSWTWSAVDGDFGSVSLSNDNELIIVKSWKKRISISLRDGTIIEQVESQNPSNPRGFLINGNYFFEENDDSRRTSYLLKVSASNLKNEALIHKLEDSISPGSLKSIESLSYYTDPSNDIELLLFQRRMAQPNRVDICALNLNSSTLEWELKNIEPNGSSSLHNFKIIDQKAYFQGLNTIYCIDILKGEILWDQRFLAPKRQFAYDDLTFIKEVNMLILKTDTEPLIAFDATNGRILIEDKEKTGYGANKGHYYNNIYYYINAEHELVGYDFEKKEVVLTKKSNLHNHSAFRGPVAIDQERGILYACDSRHMIAFDIKD